MKIAYSIYKNNLTLFYKMQIKLFIQTGPKYAVRGRGKGKKWHLKFE